MTRTEHSAQAIVFRGWKVLLRTASKRLHHIDADKPGGNNLSQHIGIFCGGTE